MAKKLLFLTCLIACWNFTVVLGNSTPSVETALSCPAPGNFHVVSVSSTYVNLAWNPVPGVTGYLLRTFEANGVLVSSMTVNDTFATVDGLQPGTAYYSLLSSECEGEPGIGTPNVARVDFLTLIIDLIVYASGTNGAVTDNFGNCTSLPWDPSNNTYWFEITEDGTNKFAQFQVHGIFSTDKPTEIKVAKSPTNTLIAQHLDEYHNLPPKKRIAYVIIYDSIAEEDIYIVRITESIGGGIKICGEDLVDDEYTFRLLRLHKPIEPGGGIQDGFGDPGDGHRSDEGIENAPDQFYVLNPFAEYLYVHAPQQPEGACNIQLFDLNGKLVLEQSYATGQEQYLLPTADLPPGFYFLRMENAGKVHTCKVVKSE